MSGRGRRVVVVAVLVLLAGGGGWWAWRGAVEDPRLVELRVLQEDLIRRYPPDKGPRSLGEAAERVAAIGGFMLKVQGLPAELRPRAIQSGREALLRLVDDKARAYFALPPADRQAFLDEEIRQGELMRKAFEAGQAVMKWTGVAGRGSQASARPGPATDRNRWRKELIDRTTAAQRSRITEYIGVLESRRRQLGLPPAAFGP